MNKILKPLVALLFFQGVTLFANNAFLSSTEIETYYQEGYFIKRGAIDSSQLDEISAQYDTSIHSIIETLSQDTYPISESVQKVYLGGSQVVFKKQGTEDISILRIVGCGSMEPQFLSLLRSDQMLNTFFALLNADTLEHLICQMHPKIPNDGVSFPKHYDIQHRMNFDPEWVDINNNGSYAICTIAIDPMTPENGGLFVDRSSFPTKHGEEEIVSIELNPGDMLFIHPELLHWSYENTSNKSRYTLLTGFCVFGANHRNYPGNCTNDIFNIDGSSTPAPWKVVDDTNF